MTTHTHWRFWASFPQSQEGHLLSCGPKDGYNMSPIGNSWRGHDLYLDGWKWVSLPYSDLEQQTPFILAHHAGTSFVPTGQCPRCGHWWSITPHVDIDLPKRHFPLPEREVFVPQFYTDPFEGGKVNDRFAYGSVAAMEVRHFPCGISSTLLRKSARFQAGHGRPVARQNCAIYYFKSWNTIDFVVVRCHWNLKATRRLSDDSVSTIFVTGRYTISRFWCLARLRFSIRSPLPMKGRWRRG